MNTWEEITVISGPVSMYIYEYNNKKYYFFGDKHHGRATKCQEKGYKCDSFDYSFTNVKSIGSNCSQMGVLLHNWFVYNNDHNIKTDFYLETFYTKENKRFNEEENLQLINRRKQNNTQIQTNDAPFENKSWLELVSYIMAPCFIREKENCPYYPNVHAHYIDVRTLIINFSDEKSGFSPVVSPKTNTVIEAVNDVTNTVIDLVNNVIEVVNNVTDPVIEVVNHVTDPIIEVVNHVTDPVIEVARDNLNDVANEVSDITDLIIEKVNDPDKVTESVNELVNESINKVINEVVDGVNKVVSAVSDDVSEVVYDIKDEVVDEASEEENKQTYVAPADDIDYENQSQENSNEKDEINKLSKDRTGKYKYKNKPVLNKNLRIKK